MNIRFGYMAANLGLGLHVVLHRENIYIYSFGRWQGRFGIEHGAGAAWAWAWAWAGCDILVTSRQDGTT
jgi:hypothetical protein